MSQTFTINQHIIQQWLLDNKNLDQIRAYLLEQGEGQEGIEAYMMAFEKAKVLRRQMTGFLFMGIGALLGLTGCIIALINPNVTMYYLGLYGFTSLAIVIVFVGLYYLFEK